MITTVLLDFDGVLTKEFNATGIICKNLCEAIPGLSLDPLIECHRRHCGRLLVEQTTYADVLDDFCACVGQKISPEILKNALRTFARNEPMFALVESLRPQYRLGMITDNSFERMALIDEDMKLSTIFNPMIISASIGTLKHDGTTTIFDAALKAANCKPEEAVFIDNQKRNLVTPAQMGMKTYWHDDAKNDVPALLDFLRGSGVAF